MFGTAVKLGQEMWAALAPSAQPQAAAAATIRQGFQNNDPAAAGYQRHLDQLLATNPRAFVEKYVEYAHTGRLDPRANPLANYSAQLAGADLSNVNFRGIPLERMAFNRTNLRGANFDGCNLGRATFVNCNLDGAKFNHVRGGEMTIRGGTAHGAEFNFARMPNLRVADVSATGVQAAHADWGGASMRNVNFEHLGARHIRLAGMSAAGSVTMSHCELTGMVTDPGTLAQINFNGGQLDATSEVLAKNRDPAVARNHLEYDYALLGDQGDNAPRPASSSRAHRFPEPAFGM